MRLANKPGSIIGRFIYYEGDLWSRRRVVRVVHNGFCATIISENDDGTENSGPFDVYTFEPRYDAPRLTLQDLQ